MTRITSSGPAGRLGAAMIPMPARDVMSWSSWGPVAGSPRLPVPAPRPAAVPHGYAFTALHTSQDAPEAWNPGVYYQPHPPKSAAGMATDSDNQMPVPARLPSGKPAVAARRPVFLGQTQVGARYVTPWYPWRQG
jgi:hypothetical protein